MAVRTHRALQLSKEPTQQPLYSVRLRIDILHPNRPMWCLDLDLIALPLVFPQQAEIADKVPSGGAELTELGRILDKHFVKGNVTVVRREG